MEVLKKKQIAEAQAEVPGALLKQHTWMSKVAAPAQIEARSDGPLILATCQRLIFPKHVVQTIFQVVVQSQMQVQA